MLEEPHVSVGSGALVTDLENPQEGRFIPSRTDNRSRSPRLTASS